MPIISMFYGIIIRLYLMDNKQHNLPHVHAKYAEFEASIDIVDGEILSGELAAQAIASCAGLDRAAPRRTDGRLGTGCQWRESVQNRSTVRPLCIGM